VTSPASCAACGGTRLVPHLDVKGSAGEQGLIPTTDAFGTALGDIVRCLDCGHMQLDSFPDEAELSEAYADAASDDYVEEEAGQRETARRIIERIEAHTDRGRVADLGCWVGFFLAEAVARGWEGQGVEPSAFGSSFATERLGLDVVQAELLEADLEPSSFDAVFMGDVIEHLPAPSAALDRAAELLRPGGVLALALPDSGSRLARAMGRRWWSVIPTHVQYFTRESLGLLLRRHGFAPLTVATSPKAFSVRYYLERLEGYNPAVSGGLVGLAERAGLADRMWAPDFRDRMLMIARSVGT
jgi:SAM-dependent methyltransferase